MSLADLSGDVQKRFQKTKLGYVDIPSEIVSKVAAENHSLQSLSERVETLTSRVTILSSVAAAMAVVFGLLAGWLALEPVLFADAGKVAKYQVEIARPALANNRTEETEKEPATSVNQAPGGDQSTN